MNRRKLSAAELGDIDETDLLHVIALRSRQHSGDDVFLAVVALGKVLDGHARGMITMSTSANGWVPNMPDGHRICCHSGAGGAKIPIGSA